MHTILVTGASRGLGLELVKQHLGQGDTVYATYRNLSSELESIATRIGTVRSVERDVSVGTSVSKAAGIIAESVSRLESTRWDGWSGEEMGNRPSQQGLRQAVDTMKMGGASIFHQFVATAPFNCLPRSISVAAAPQTADACSNDNGIGLSMGGSPH